jgi:hopene-associated glycosyltransferase HpnB
VRGLAAYHEAMSGIAIAVLSVWAYLILAHGRFWSSCPELAPAVPASCPDVDIVVPARDEEQTIGAVIASLVKQDYSGKFRIILVDDNSSDETAERAGSAPNLQVLSGEPKPAGWAGKMWALRQGVRAGAAPLILFTDADIVHDPRHLSTLIARLAGLDLVSEMVRLNCESLAERSLVPAFVYFFQMLYPFKRVNDPRCGVAAAAGGTVLITREMLERIGGIESIRDALIDDVALATKVKAAAGALYLGHSGLAASIRPYPRFADLWHMIARSAFTQLRYSAMLLFLTLISLSLVWLAPVALVLAGRPWERLSGFAALALSAASYLPTLRRYRRSPLWAPALPLIAAFYMAATVGSALNYWRGAGTRWKSRSYGA